MECVVKLSDAFALGVSLWPADVAGAVSIPEPDKRLKFFDSFGSWELGEKSIVTAVGLGDLCPEAMVPSRSILLRQDLGFVAHCVCLVPPRSA